MPATTTDPHRLDILARAREVSSRNARDRRFGRYLAEIEAAGFTVIVWDGRTGEDAVFPRPTP